MSTHRLRPRHWAQLLALSFTAPLFFLVQQFRSQPSFRVATAIGIAVFVLSVGVALALLRTGRSTSQSIAVASMLVIAFWYWPTLTATSWLIIPDWVVGILLTGLLVTVGSTYADHRYFRTLLLVGSITPAVAFSVLLVAAELGRGDLASVVIPPALTDTNLTTEEPPDIYLLVLDSYARADILQSIYDYDNTAFLNELTNQGFAVPAQATANYSMSHYSLASLMSMEYITQLDVDVSVTDLRTLGEMTRGDSRVVNLFKDLGYTFVSGGSDWWGSRCSNDADICLPTTPLDMTAYTLLSGTPVGPLLYPQTGDPGTAITLQRLDEFSRWYDIRDSWQPQPHFVAIHLRLPHPPLYLTSGCQPRITPQHDGYVLREPFMPEQLVTFRRDAYIEQVECANHLTRQFLDQIPADDIVIIIGDHGPDSAGQVQRDPASWSNEDRAERFSVLTAIRIPDDCPTAIPDNISHVNIFRHTLQCVTTLNLPTLPNHHYHPPNALHRGQVSEVSLEEALKGS